MLPTLLLDRSLLHTAALGRLCGITYETVASRYTEGCIILGHGSCAGPFLFFFLRLWHLPRHYCSSFSDRFCSPTSDNHIYHETKPEFPADQLMVHGDQLIADGELIDEPIDLNPDPQAGSNTPASHPVRRIYRSFGDAKSMVP